ncbi:MAG: hypothetical protein K5925_01845 [Bacilli bacterium]|nr:hypothetical protein [Bacilli bacterium]
MLKNSKLAVLSLLGVLALTGCNSSSDEIYSKPSDYDKEIITIDGSSEKIHHNVLSIIYDAMHDGSISSKTLDEALYRYAESVFGTYNEVTAPEGSQDVTLKEAAAGTAVGAPAEKVAKTVAFIKAHKAYWYYNEEGEHVQNDGVTVIKEGEDWEPGSHEFAHVEAKWDAIETRIAEAMYEKVNAGAYTQKNFFSEERLLKALHEDGKKVRNYITSDFDRSEKIIPYSLEGRDVFDAIIADEEGNDTVALHREYYQSSVYTGAVDIPVATYIEDEIIPSVYNDLLIEQYLLDEDVAAVRNSRARQINVLKIEKYNNFTLNADKLVKKLVEEIYTLPANTVEYLRTDADEIEEYGDNLFQKYALVEKGLYNQIQDAKDDSIDNDAWDIVHALQEEGTDIYEEATSSAATGSFKYYKHTTAGDLAQDYDEVAAINDWYTMNSSKYSTFTSSGTRTIKEGYEQQLIDIMQKEYITKGWYIQSKTPGLDSNGTINDRLFKLSIANAKIEVNGATDEQGQKTDAYKELEAADRFVKDATTGDWSIRAEASETENRFLCSINGAYYLKFDGKSATDDWKNDIVYDDGSAYYIVQVLEAAKDSKLRNTNSTNYAHTRGQAFMDMVIDEIAKIVGSTGSYSSLSKNHWLEKMDLSFYDQEVYDYFKSNYPDIFED